MVRRERGGTLKAIMALFILSIVGLLATAALLWCLIGFSRALQEKPKVIGLLVRMDINDASLRQHKAKVIAFPERLSVAKRASAARFRKYGSLKLLILAGLTMLLASPGSRPNLTGLTSAIFPSNSEIQKTVFVEVFEMQVQRDS